MMTGFPLADYGQQMQPQYTSYNVSCHALKMTDTDLAQPFHAQMMMQQQQQAQQEEYMRHMALAEQQRQQEEYMRQQYLLQQQQEQQRQQQMQQSLFAQPTGYGSNNPFAPNQPQQPQQQAQPEPQQSFLPVPVISQQQAPSPAPQPIQAAPKPAFNPAPKKDDGEYSGLAALLARGREDGMDTFGNTGNLRQYTQVQISTQADCLRHSRRYWIPRLESHGCAEDGTRPEQPIRPSAERTNGQAG